MTYPLGILAFPKSAGWILRPAISAHFSTPSARVWQDQPLLGISETKESLDMRESHPTVTPNLTKWLPPKTVKIWSSKTFGTSMEKGFAKTSKKQPHTQQSPSRKLALTWWNPFPPHWYNVSSLETLKTREFCSRISNYSYSWTTLCMFPVVGKPTGFTENLGVQKWPLWDPLFLRNFCVIFAQVERLRT